MGNIVGGITNALFGKGGAGTAGDAVRLGKTLGADAKFKGYTVTTGAGTAGSDGAGNLTSTLSDPYSQILAKALAGSSSLFDQAAAFDPNARAKEIFDEQALLLRPEFQRQVGELEQSAFGRGTLGKRIAGEALGAGRGSGMVNQDAYGLSQAQNQALLALAPLAREQAFGEQATLTDLAMNMLNAGMSINQLEQNLLGLGVDAETARAAASYASGMMQLDPYKTLANIEQDQRGQNAGFAGAVLGGALSGGLFSGGGSAPVKTLPTRAGFGPLSGGYGSGFGSAATNYRNNFSFSPANPAFRFYK